MSQFYLYATRAEASRDLADLFTKHKAELQRRGHVIDRLGRIVGKKKSTGDDVLTATTEAWDSVHEAENGDGFVISASQARKGTTRPSRAPAAIPRKPEWFGEPSPPDEGPALVLGSR